MKYAIFDEKGLPKAFYDKSIHGNKIPKEAIEITDEQWKEFINNQGKRAWDFENKQVIDISNKIWDNKKQEWQNKTIDEILQPIKQSKILQLKQDFKTLRNETAHILSKTINKEINARQQDLVNIDSLISILPDNTATIEFRCYDNSFVEVSKQQLLSIKKEIIQEGVNTYKRKWILEQKIKSATSVDELNSIKWDGRLNEVDNT